MEIDTSDVVSRAMPPSKLIFLVATREPRENSLTSHEPLHYWLPRNSSSSFASASIRTDPLFFVIVGHGRTGQRVPQPDEELTPRGTLKTRPLSHPVRRFVISLSTGVTGLFPVRFRHAVKAEANCVRCGTLRRTPSSAEVTCG